MTKSKLEEKTNSHGSYVVSQQLASETFISYYFFIFFFSLAARGNLNDLLSLLSLLLSQKLLLTCLNRNPTTHLLSSFQDLR